MIITLALILLSLSVLATPGLQSLQKKQAPAIVTNLTSIQRKESYCVRVPFLWFIPHH